MSNLAAAPEFVKPVSDATAIIATAMPLLPRPPFIPGQGKAPKIRRGKPCNALPVHAGDWAVKLPWVSLNPEHARALGIEGGVVVSALEQWYKPDRKGKAKIDITDCTGVYWIARSHAEFVACTGMTKKQVETGINDAIKAGIIETRVMPFGRKKIRKLHLRIVAADGAATLKGPLVIGAKPPVLQYVVIGQSAPVRFGMGGKARRSAFQIHNTTGTTNATEKSKATSAKAKNTGTPEGSQGEAKNQTATPDVVLVEKIGKVIPDGVQGAAPKLLGIAVQYQGLFGLEMDATSANMLKGAAAFWREQGINPPALLTFLRAAPTLLTWEHCNDQDPCTDLGSKWFLRQLCGVKGRAVVAKAFIKAGGKPKVKPPKKSALHTTPTAPPMPDALASAPAVALPEASPCAGTPAPAQAATGLTEDRFAEYCPPDTGEVPIGLTLDLLNPNLSKHHLKEEVGAWYYIGLDRPVAEAA